MINVIIIKALSFTLQFDFSEVIEPWCNEYIPVKLLTKLLKHIYKCLLKLVFYPVCILCMYFTFLRPWMLDKIN